MNEKVKQAQETLLKLSSLALEYLVSNFHFSNKEYPKLKKEIGNLTDKLRLTLNDFDRYHESQQDLIKGKDEYIAKLCNDRAELKEYKSIEQELGIDLITFAKLEQENEIYDKEEEGYMSFDYIDFKDKRLVCVDDFDESSNRYLEYYYYFKDYGKKWALTKDELKVKKVVEKYGL